MKHHSSLLTDYGEPEPDYHYKIVLYSGEDQVERLMTAAEFAQNVLDLVADHGSAADLMDPSLHDEVRHLILSHRLFRADKPRESMEVFTLAPSEPNPNHYHQARTLLEQAGWQLQPSTTRS